MKRNAIHQRSPVRIVGLVVVLLVAAACASGNGDPASETSATTSEPETDSTTTTSGATEVPDADDEETYTIRFANFLGPDAAQILANIWWANEVEARTDGRVQVEFFHSGALLDATDTLPGIGDGRADMGYAVHFYHPGELPLSTISELPFMTTNPQVQTRAFTKLYQESDDFRAEWEAFGVHVLHFNPSGVIILGSQEQVTSLDQLDGLQVRAVGYAAEALQELGANPIAMPAPEIYESVQRGLLDAYSSFPFEVIASAQLQEVAPYVVDLGLGNYLITAAPINLELWNSLPEDIRQIMTEVSAELTETAVWDIYADVENSVCEAIGAAGGVVSVLPEAEVDQWRSDIGDRFIDRWLESVGSGGEEFLDQYESAIAEYEADATFESGVRRCAGA